MQLRDDIMVEAIERTLKENKENAERERDEKATQLQQAILDADQRLEKEQTSHQTELERLQRDLKIIRDAAEKEKKLASRSVKEMEENYLPQIKDKNS